MRNGGRAAEPQKRSVSKFTASPVALTPALSNSAFSLSAGSDPAVGVGAAPKRE